MVISFCSTKVHYFKTIFKRHATCFIKISDTLFQDTDLFCLIPVDIQDKLDVMYPTAFFTKYKQKTFLKKCNLTALYEEDL